MTRLIARKRLKYNTRQLVPGDEFDTVRRRDDRVLIATRQARLAPEPAPTEPAPAPASATPPPAPVKPPPPVTVRQSLQSELLAPDERELEALRTKAEALGIAVDKRWGVRRLQAEIEQAKGEPKGPTA